MVLNGRGAGVVDPGVRAVVGEALRVEQERRRAAEARVAELEGRSASLRDKAAMAGKPGAGRRGYQAAKATHLTDKMHREARSVVDPSLTWQRDGRRVRQIGRWLYMNTAAGKRTVRFLAQRVIGPNGIQPQFTDERIDEAFAAWSRSCRRGNRRTWAAAQSMLLSEYISAGEGFHRRDVRGGNLEIVAFLPEQLSGMATVNLAAGNYFLDGVEYDEFGVPVRYHVERQLPTLVVRQVVDVFDRIRVVHLFHEDRPGQCRGFSQFAAGAVNLFDVSDAVYAELVAMRMQGYAGLHVKPGPDESAVLDQLGAEPVEDGTTVNDSPALEIAMEAGQVIEYAGDISLLAGNRPSGTFLPFVSKLVQDWAVSVGVPTWVVEGDYSKANYSSMRAAEVTCRPTFEEMQQLVIDVQAEPDVRSWLTWAVLTGAVGLRRGQTVESVMRDVEWQKPGFPYVDVMKEAQADGVLMANGVKTFDQLCAERGLSGRDQRWRIARSRELDGEYGVETPTVQPRLVPSGMSAGSSGADVVDDDDDQVDDEVGGLDSNPDDVDGDGGGEGLI